MYAAVLRSPFQDLSRLWASERVVRKEDHRHRKAIEFVRPQPPTRGIRRQQGAGDLDGEAGSVTRGRVCRYGTAMRQTDQGS